MAMRVVGDEEERSRDAHPAGKRRYVLQLINELREIKQDIITNDKPLVCSIHYPDGSVLTIQYEPARAADG